MRTKLVTTTTDFRRRSLILSGASMLAVGNLPLLAQAQNTPVTIGVGADPVFTAFFVAANEKLFAKHGVNAVVQPYTDGGEALNALVAQQVNLACAAEPTHIVRLARAPLKPLAVAYQSSRYLKLVARKEIASVDKIKKFGMVPGTVSEYLTGITMKKFGIDAKSVELVRSGPPELPALLARGDIDGYFVWEPWPALGVKQGGHILLTNGEVGFLNTLWLSATSPWLDSNKEKATAVLRALAEASDITRKDPKRAAASVQAITKIPQTQTLTALQDMEPVIRDFTDEDIKTANGVADFLLSQKAIAAPVDMSKVLQRGFFKG
jgi:NitT/TauT family transport system substrate-binding protein